MMCPDMQPMVSVIMPVYNAGEYLRGAVESVLRQTYEDLELLLVDDGSTDGSGALCDGFAAQDARVRVIHKPNGGICDARNHGLAAAGGKYIAFCDNDDVMLPECLARAVAAGESSGAEIVRFRRRLETIMRDGTRRTSEARPSPERLIALDSWQSYLAAERAAGTHGVWAGIYRRDFLEEHGICFDLKARSSYEDAIFVAQCFAQARAAAVLPDLLYVWEQRDGRSTSRKMDEEIFRCREYAIKQWIRCEDQIAARTGRTEDETAARRYYYLQYILFELGLTGYDSKRKMAEWKRLKRDILQDSAGAKVRTASLKDRFQMWCIRRDHLKAFYFARDIYNRLRSRKI